MPLFSFEGKSPTVHPDAWIAPTATLVGDVTIEADASVWYGASATGCLRIGAVCAGGRARIARDGGIAGPSANAGGGSRTASELLAAVALPVASPRLTVTPLLALGAAWTRTEAAPRADTDRLDDLGLRAEVALAAGLALGRRWSIGGEIGASVVALSATTAQQTASGDAPARPPRALGMPYEKG